MVDVGYKASGVAADLLEGFNGRVCLSCKGLPGRKFNVFFGLMSQITPILIVDGDSLVIGIARLRLVDQISCDLIDRFGCS
jgi:hypothetical protein